MTRGSPGIAVRNVVADQGRGMGPLSIVQKALRPGRARGGATAFATRPVRSDDRCGDIWVVGEAGRGDD